MEFGLVRIALALAMLGTAALFDVRKREVSDLLWIVFAVAAGILYLVDFHTTSAELMKIDFPLGLTAGISFGIYKSRLFGGADMLCLIVFAAIIPTNDKNLIEGILPAGQVIFHPFASLTVLTNALILSLSGIIVNIVKNLSYSRSYGGLFYGLEDESTIRKTIALLIGHRTKTERPRYAFPIEITIGGKRRFDFAPKSVENAEYEMRSDVWVMSGMPLIVYMLAGFIAMLLAGDLMALLFSVFGPA
jgi:archaeal preflagellin peptidase FlaK